MALYDAENRKKKKDQVQRQTDTGTGRAQGQAKPGIVKPGAKRVNTPSPAPTPKPTTTTATVAKPGVTKGATTPKTRNAPTQQTDTGTGRKGTVRLETPKQTKEEKQAESRRRQRITEERQQAEASKKRLENNQKLMGEGKTSRYQQYVLGEKTRQYAQDLDEQSLATAIKQRQRDDALRNWNLDAAKKEREQISQDADKAKIALRSLTPQINYYEARGDHATADMLRQQQVALQQQVNKLAEFDRDYEQARSLQYYQKGGEALDHIKEADAAVWSHIDTIAHGSADWSFKHAADAGSDIGAEKMDTAKIRAEDDAIKRAKEALRKAGYKEKDIEQLVDYRVRQLNEERTLDMIAQAQQLAQTDPFGASVASVGTNIMGGLGFLDAAAQKLTNPDRPLDYNTKAQAPSLMTNTVRGQVSQDLIDKYGERGKTYAFLYQTGMSMADSGVNMMLGAAGMPEALGLAVMAGGAATSSMKEAHDRGLSDSQALKIGLISGIAEYGTEKIGLDAFLNTVFKRTKGSHAAARALLTNVFAEGGEEVASDMINLAADLLISQDKSEWEQKIQQYRDLGFTDSEAFSKVLAEQIKDTGLSFLGGALSGGVMGGGGLALNHVIDNHTEELLYAGYAAGDGTEAKSAAQNLMDLQRKLSVKEKAGEKLTEDDQRAYTAAVDQLKSAMDSMDSETRRDLMQVGRETRKSMVQEAKVAKKAAKQVSRMVKETAQNQRQTETTETTETVETVEQGGTESTEAVEQKEQPSKPRYSDNATVQQAAELVAEGRTSKAVTTVMQNAEAQAGLGLDFSRGATNMEKRTAIKTALEALVRENTEAPVEVNNSTEASPETGSPAAVSAETETETETRESTAEDSFEEATAVVPNQLISYETFAKDLREGNPDVTEEESRALYKEVQQAVEASQYAAERDGQKVYLQSADRVVDYKEFRGMAQAEAKRNGATYEEAVIRDAFDTAFRETQTGVQEHETRRREKLNKTAENINKAFDARELGFRVRVSYDGADFAARGVKENAFVDVKNHEIVFNGDVMDSSGAMLWYLGHEVFHPAADVDTELVDTVIDTFQKLLDAGKLTGRLAATVRNADAKIARTRELYQRHENELAEKAGRKAETISEAQAREEFAADLMRYAFSSTQLCKDIVGQKPTVAMRMRQAVSRVLKAVSGGDDSDTSLRDELQKLADRLDAALERVSDNVKNADVEAFTADNMSSDDLSGVTDTKGERMFSLSTMRQDIDGYMQDLRDAGLVGEGKVMTEAEVTGLYDGINRVMNFVEKHIDEIERNENYRDMTAETRPFSPYKPNSDPHYKMALDFSTLCRKRLLTQAITERLQKALGRALTPVEQVKIRDMIKKLQAEGKKIDVACALCYVEAARLKSPKVINDFLAHRADNIWNYHSLQDKTFKNDVYAKRSGDWKEQHGLPRNATKDQIKAAGFKVSEYNKFMLAVRKNYQNWLQQNNPERFAALEKAVADAEALDASAFLGAQSLARMRQDNPDLYDTFITKVRQATRSKAQETDVPYVRGDVNQVGEALIEQMNEESGFRHQSWSDFQAMHLLDSIAAIIELSTRKAKMHTYTKVADMVRFLGNTGMMMNMSLIPAGETGFDENGNLLFDPVEGMEYQTMLDLRRKFHATAGNIAIGISDAQILAMMASDEIDYIIPYHTSGLNADMRKRMGIRAWQDYTKSQNEKGDDWEHKAPHLGEWYNEKEALLAPDGVVYMVEASKKYLQLCHERGLVPKFSQFLQKNSDGSYSLRDDAQNYWKLLIDRKMVDQYTGGVIAQQAVVPRFDVDTMLDILSSEVNSQAAKDAREAEDYIVQKVLENGEGIVSKAERAELENRARILRDAALRGIVQNAAEEMGIGQSRQFSVEDNDSSEKYSWDALSKKAPIRIVSVPTVGIPTTKRGKIDATKFQAVGKTGADTQIGAMGSTQTYVTIPDIGENVLINNRSIRHGLQGQLTNAGTRATAEVTASLPDILRNSIAVNAQTAREDKPDDGLYSYILFGYARRNDGQEYLVRSKVNHFAQNKSVVESVEIYNVLKGIKAKKIEARVKGSHTDNVSAASHPTADTSTMSVADLLGIVKENYPEFLNDSLREHYGITDSKKEAGLRYSIDPLTEKQQNNADFNASQTKVGSALRTLNGTLIKRYRDSVGKNVGGQVYLHRAYATDVIPQDVLTSAEEILQREHPDFGYVCVMYDRKNGTVRFDEAPDFDTAREPIPGNYVIVDPSTGKTKTGYSDYIWHHKWMWVKNDYKGFDVAESWNWSKAWLSVLRDTGDKVANRGVANGSGHGTANWDRQLEYFGLPLDAAGDRRFSVEQKFTSEDTSIPQTASTFTNFKFPAGSRILDYGGGQYNLAKEAIELAYGGAVTLEVVDAFNRTSRHNERILSAFEDDPADIVTVNNVLNVIQEPSVRKHVAEEAKRYVAPGGIVYFCFYKADESDRITKANKGNEKRSSYQTGMPTESYIPELKQVFTYVEKVGNFLLASDEPITKDRYTRAKKDDPTVASIKAYSKANAKGSPSFRYGEISLSELDDRYVAAAQVNPENGEYDAKAIREIAHHIALREGIPSKEEKALAKIQRDANGNVIPPSQRIRMDEENFIRYSISPEQDEEYLELAKDPVRNAARLQEMVDEAARAAGYDTKGYHGTSKKFTVFDTKRSGENWGGDSRLGPGLYFAYDKDTALKWTDGTTVIDAWLSMKKPLDLRKRASSDIAAEIKKRTERKLREYEEWYPVSKEQYKKNLQRVEDMYLNDPALFIDEFKYDKNGEMTDNIRTFLAGLGYDGLLSKDEIVVFNPNQIKSADPVTYDDNGNVIPLSERFNTEQEDTRYSLDDPNDVGYTAGDLGKSRGDGYWNMKGRGTGHFGTGTYFVGDKALISDSHYGKRPVERADFAQYNLFRPRDADQGYELHEELKKINDNIERLPDAMIDFDEYWRAKRDAEDAMYDAAEDPSKRQIVLDYIRKYLGQYAVDELQYAAQKLYDDIHFEATEETRQAMRKETEDFRKQFENSHPDEKIRWAQTVDEEVADQISRKIKKAADYADDVDMSVDDLMFKYGYDLEQAVERATEKLDALRTWYSRAVWRLQSALGYRVTEAQVQDALQKTYDTVQTYTDRNAYYDSASTVFMKALGYEGIDVRGIKGLDNTAIGSVIYDLKGEDLARKKEIGTAKYSLTDTDQTDFDPNDDPMMQAFFDAYEEAHGEGQTKIDYPTLNQRLRAAERARKKAEVQLASEQAKRSLAEAETKDNRLAWQIYAKKMLRTKDREYRAKMSALRREKMEAVKAAVQQTREVERAYAAVRLDKQHERAKEHTKELLHNQRERMNERTQEKLAEQKLIERMEAGRKQAAMRLGVREDTYARKAKEQDNAKLRRNAAKAALRNKNLAEKRREKVEIEQGPVSTLRKTAKERKAMENRQNLGQKLRTKGRALYRDFVSKCMAIDFDVSRRQRGGMKAGTLATIVGSVGSTTETMFTDALVDRAGNRIGESMTRVFLCTEGDKGKVIDENRQRLLQDYMLHRHNIDRMSIVANTRARLEAFEAENPWLSEMDGKEFARLVALTDKEAEKSGQTRARELARQYGDLLQEFNEARDKPVFPDQKGNPVTAETSREKVEQYEAENPWLKDKAEGIYKWWDSFMRAWVVGDSITEEQYDRMRELYPHYVPTYRVDKGGMGFSFTSSNGATPGQLVKKATGSLREIVNIEDSFANLVAKAVKQARVNELYKNLVDTAMLDSDGVFADCMFFDWLEFGEKTGTRDLAMLDVGEQLELREKAGLTKDGSGYRVSAWYDGELVPVYVSEDLFQSLSDTVGASSDKLDKVARLGSKLTAPMKTAITGINVNFALRNLTRDLPTAIINSTSGLAFPVYWAKAWKHMLSNSEHWQRYNALGGGNALYYNTEGGFGKNMNMEAGALGSMQRGWDKFKTAIGVVNESTEAVTRFAEYLATVERLGDTYEARLQGIKNAAEVTVDFSRHGRYGKAINNWIPYWNPAVQGIDKVIRSVVETPEGQTKVGHALRTLGRAAVTTALLEAVMQLIYNALGKRDDWDELDDRTKDTYYCIPTGDHTFIKIPKNREWGAILGTPLMRLIEGYNGRENPFENYIETSIIPNFLPGMPTDMIGFSQYIDLATNKDFAGRTIVPYAYQQGSKAGQYDSETSGLSHWLSDRIGNAISPMQLDYIIKDYFGDFGKMFTMATSEGLWSGEKTPEEVADYALDIVKKPWEADNRFSNQYTSRYYETISQLEDTYNDKKNHSDGESYKDSVEYRTYQAMNKLYGKQISEISKSLRDETNEEIKAAGKAQIVQLAKQALAFYDDCMSGKVSNPELTAAYSDLPGSVSDELIRLDGLGKEYSFRPSESTTSSYVDQTSKVNGKATREYVLDDEAKAKLNGLREERYVDYFQRTINTQAYKNASDTGKATLLEEARDNAYADAKEEFMAWLVKNRRPTPRK